MPRLLEAISYLVMGSGPLKNRLPAALTTIEMLPPASIPSDIEPFLQEMTAILARVKLPHSVDDLSDERMRSRAYYLSPRNARRVAKLIMTLTEQAVWSMARDD